MLLNDDNIRVKLDVVDFEKSCKKSIKKDKGFIITDKSGKMKKPAKSTGEKNKAKYDRTENGIFSPKFGTTWGDVNAFAEKYSCKCRKTIGKRNEGEICEHCATEVKFRDVPLNIYGWFWINDYRLIHPNMYNMIESLVGGKQLVEMLDYEKGTDIKGNYDALDWEEINKSNNLNKYKNIGMIEFINHFDEIMDFFVNKKKHKKNTYDFIMQNRHLVFSHAFPIYSALMRPALMTQAEFSYHDINRYLESLSSKIYRINNTNKRTPKKEILKLLYETQVTINKTYAMTRDSLTQKEGDFRGKVMGSRYNFTARCVIRPITGTKINEIEMPYIVMLEFFKPKIINILKKTEKITYNEALNKWIKAKIKFSDKIYGIMKYILKNSKYGIFVIINRPPTVAYGSSLVMRVKKISKNMSNYCLGIPINVCGDIRGDFDGDVLSIFELMGEKQIQSGNKIFNPRTNMQVSRTDGEFNPNAALVKDQMISLNYFNSL